MSRKHLIEIAERYTKWTSSPDASHEALAAIVSPEVVVHTPWQGLSPDFSGLLARHAMIHAASNDFRLNITQVSVDEENSTVTQVWEVNGHHTGYTTPFPHPPNRGAPDAGSVSLLPHLHPHNPVLMMY
jgi:hypothetical protein